MSGFDVAATVALVALLAVQIWLTVRVWKSPSYERSQKVLQSKLIWLLPVVGAVLVFSLMPDEDDPPRPRTQLKG
jgi:hypothetical protein